MTDREKQIKELRALLFEKSNSANVEPVFTDENGEEHYLPDEAIKVLNDILEKAFIPFLAEVIIDNGYRKMDEVTLKLDLGDRSEEEIKQIAEAFNGDIKKQVAKEILQDWYDDVVHGMGVDGYYIKEYAKKYGVEIEE